MARKILSIARKILGGLCLVMALGGFAAAIMVQGGPVAANIIIAVLFLAAGLLLIFKKGKSEEKRAEQKAEKAERKAEKQQAKEKRKYTLACRYVGGLSLEPGCFCTLHFEESEIVVYTPERTFRISYEKIVNLKIDSKINIERRWGYSISGAIIGGAAFGAAGAGLLGVKEKKRRTVDEYLVINYNHREGAVSSLVFLSLESIKMRRLITMYLPRCKGQPSDVSL